MIATAHPLRLSRRMSLRHWIVLAAVALPTAALADSRSVCKTGGKGLNIRTSPSIHAGRMGGLSDGADFRMLGTSQNGAWVKVKSGGRTGWVSRQYVCGGGNASSSGGGSGAGNASSGSGSGSGSGDAPEPTVDTAPVTPGPGGFVNPVPGSCRSSGYGHRRDPFHGTRKFHDGSDFAAPNGTPMRSAFGGTVVRAGQIRGYGYAVVVRRDNADGSSTFALYGHMCCGKGKKLGRSSIKVGVGDRVEAGQLIGQVGTTGRSTGPHLHMLMRQVPRGASAGYRNPNSASFFNKKYAANPENHISVGGCGSRRGTGGDDDEHDHGDHDADEAQGAGMGR